MLIASTCVVLAFAWGPCGPSRGQEPEQSRAPVLGAAELLRSLPFDRITLNDGIVLIIEPVSPRPLPTYDPKKERERRRRATEKNAPIEIGGAAEPAKDRTPASEKDGDEATAEEVKIHLLQGGLGAGEVRDFRIKRSSIKKIEYFEDLLLQESDRLVLAHDYSRAFDCCLRVQARNPAWSGLDEHVDRILYAEGSRALLDGDGERGLRLLRELLGRRRNYPGLLDQLATAYGKRIERALAMGLHARGRRVLHELEAMAPEHGVVGQMRGRFIAKATKRFKDAEAASGPQRLDALVDALRIWPALEGVESRYLKAFAAEPTLEVGVTDVATLLGPWVHSRADKRVTRLLYRPILASDDDDARQGRRPGQLAASIETTDLGRRLMIRIRSGFLWSDGSRPASVSDVAHALIDRSDPHSPNYEARWAELLDRIEIPDENRVEVRLNRAPLKAGGWLVGPVGPAHAGIDGRIATATQERLLVSDGPYRCVLAVDGQIELSLSDQDASAAVRKDAGPAPSIRRIREIRLSRGQAAVTALRRGDVSMIDHVPPDQVASLVEVPEIQIGQYSQPVVHVIALDGRNPALRNRALRRALSYAVDRTSLLEDVLLRHPATGTDQPADGPFPKGNYADAPGVKPLSTNMGLAMMLVAAAQKELGGGRIKLNLEYPALPEIRTVVAKIAEAFRRTRLEITTTELGESRLESELRAGRRFELAYRLLRCEDPVLDAGPMLCPGYDAPPETNTLASAASPRILQLLLQLERASDWPTARRLAIQVDRESRDELPILPLWQLVDHFAWRARVHGPTKEAADLYLGLESWEIAPWIARDPWDAAQKATPP
jgi:peptide/nickel transport system substrate-binding protein